MNIEALKEKFLSSIDLWLEERIDDMLKNNSTLALPSVYIKRGCHNIINKYKGKISKGIDNAALFFADEEGNINMDTLFADSLELFKNIEESPFDLGLVKGSIGKGRIAITLPENIFTNIIFGSNKTIVLNGDDFLELKNLLVE